MAKNSILDDLFSLAMKIPWWLCLLIAIVVFLGFDLISTFEAPQKTTDIIGNHTKYALITSIASWLKYIIPFPFIIGGVFSLIKGKIN